MGRIVVIGKINGCSYVAYRVSSRSFPNRRAEIRGQKVLVSPLNPVDLAKSPYIAYNCIRTLETAAVVANGIHADTIIEKIEDGQKPIDAISLCLVTLGYERDDLNTPRIAGVVTKDKGWLGVARRDEIRIKEFDLNDSRAFMMATYSIKDFEMANISKGSVEEIAKAAYDLPFERPVCAAAAMSLSNGKGFDIGIYNPK